MKITVTRLVPIHITLISSFFILFILQVVLELPPSIASGDIWKQLTLTLFLFLKTIADVRAHREEHEPELYSTYGNLKAVTPQEVTKKKPALVLKPAVNTLIIITSALLPAFAFGLWAMFFLGGIAAAVLVGELNLNIPVWLIFVFFGSLFFFGVLSRAYKKRKREYAGIEYCFYSDKLKYNKIKSRRNAGKPEYTIINYKEITAIRLRKSFSQYIFGLGTIVISTSLIGPQCEIQLVDIKDPYRVYQEVNEFVEKIKERKKLCAKGGT